MMKHEVWMAAAELSPLARTGGLGEVLRALPQALSEQGVKVRRFLPLYGCVDRSGFPTHGEPLTVCLGPTHVSVQFLSKEDSPGLTTTLVECEELFGRDEIYGPAGGEFSDNPRRFALFCRSIVELAMHSPAPPDIIHSHDWPSGLIPLFVHFLMGSNNGLRPATIFSIHNLAYQGRYSPWHLQWLSLEERITAELARSSGIEFYGDISLMKAGLVYADQLITVSPTYAEDIKTEAFGFGMHGVIAEKSNVLQGILNGCDTSVWNPATDPYLPKTYTEKTFQAGRQAAKKSIQQEFGLGNTERPLLAVMGRLAHQKGIDILLDAALPIVGQGMDLAVLGEGDPTLVQILLRLRKHLPNRVGVIVGYNDRLAHLLLAGADMVALPSRYEPCGLTQMYAQKYGSVPVVHRTGGLTDTVRDADEHPSDGTGFVFSPLTADCLTSTIRRALAIWEKDKRRWSLIQKHGMQEDHSWADAARKYVDVYNELSAHPSRAKSDVLTPAVAR